MPGSRVCLSASGVAAGRLLLRVLRGQGLLREAAISESSKTKTSPDPEWPIFGVWLAPEARETFPKAGGLRPQPWKRVSRAPEAGQTPKFDHFRVRVVLGMPALTNCIVTVGLPYAGPRCIPNLGEIVDF